MKTGWTLWGLLVILTTVGCGVYSFSGGSVSPEIDTVVVYNFANQASGGKPSLSRDLTEKLKDKFISETRLNLVDRDGDLEFRGTVTSYRVSSMAPTGSETSALNRLTVGIKVECMNRKEEGKDWTQTFSRFAEYESSKDLASVEDELLEEINEQLVQDVFNKAFVDW